MFTRDFERLQHLTERWDPITDREVRLIKQRDIYRASIQFGDPFLFIHRNCDYYKRYRDLEFVHYTLDPECKDRAAYTHEIMSGFPDAKMLCHFNSQRFLSEYRIVTLYRNHILVSEK